MQFYKSFGRAFVILSISGGKSKILNPLSGAKLCISRLDNKTLFFYFERLCFAGLLQNCEFLIILEYRSSAKKRTKIFY